MGEVKNIENIGIGKSIGKVKTRKQGNSVVISMKKELNVKENQEFYMYQDKNGYITLIPKIPDYYATATDEELKNMDPDNLLKNMKIMDSEWDEYDDPS